MKKAITILAVLIVLVGAVFALEESHSIKLHTTVDEVTPVFHLVYAGATGTAAANTPITEAGQSSNKNNTAFANNGDYTYTAESRTAVEVGDISQGNITVNFNITISNPAKSLKAYDLTLDAEGFEVTKGGADAEHKTRTADPSKTLTPGGQKTGVNVTEKTENVTATAKFNGTTCSDSGTTLATYQVVYTKDPEVDPMNNAASYSADVTLTVKTN